MPTDAGAVVREVRGFGGVPWGRLFRYLRPHWLPVSIAIVALVVSSGLWLLFPLVIAGITSQVVVGGDPGGLDRLILVLFLLFCVQAVGSFLQTYLLGVVGERVAAQLRGELFGRLVALSLDFHASRRVGELISRLSNDVTIVRTMLTQTVTQLLWSVIGLVGSIIILFTLSPSLRPTILDHVSFGYGPEPLVLRDISLEIPAGETLALVGPSGSGKTTLVGSLPRLWDVSSGTIRIDGLDIRSVTIMGV